MKKEINQIVTRNRIRELSLADLEALYMQLRNQQEWLTAELTGMNVNPKDRASYRTVQDPEKVEQFEDVTERVRIVKEIYLARVEALFEYDEVEDQV